YLELIFGWQFWHTAFWIRDRANSGSDDFAFDPAQRLSAHSCRVWAAEPRRVCMFPAPCTIQLEDGSYKSPLCGAVDVFLFRKSDRPFRVDGDLLYVCRTFLGDIGGGRAQKRHGAHHERDEIGALLSEGKNPAEAQAGTDTDAAG